MKTYRQITSLSDNYCNSNTVYSSMTNFIMYINSLYTVCIEKGALCVNVKYCLNNLRKNPILFFFCSCWSWSSFCKCIITFFFFIFNMKATRVYQIDKIPSQTHADQTKLSRILFTLSYKDTIFNIQNN